jgi:hypothetical protein
VPRAQRARVAGVAEGEKRRASAFTTTAAKPSGIPYSAIFRGYPRGHQEPTPYPPFGTRLAVGARASAPTGVCALCDPDDPSRLRIVSPNSSRRLRSATFSAIEGYAREGQNLRDRFGDVFAEGSGRLREAESGIDEAARALVRAIEGSAVRRRE